MCGNAANAGATYATMSTATANMARSIHGQSMSFLSDNTTVQTRQAVGMRTQDDPDDQVPAGVSQASSWTGKQIPPPKQPKHTPKPPAKKTGALAVEVAKSAGIVVHF